MELKKIMGKRVIVKPYDISWKQAFEDIKSELDEALGNLALRIEHVGSTSVEGLSAKPIIDIDVVIENESKLGQVIEAFGRIGYHHEGNLGIPGREAFKYEGKEHLMKHHLYVCAEDAAELKRHISFRDYLRSHPEAVAEYSRIKEEGARLYPEDMDKYIEYKSSLIEKLYKKIELESALENMKKYNAGIMFNECFGFEPDVEYDALVVAPGWKPTKIIRDPAYKVTVLAEHSYFSGYLVEKDGMKIAWAQTASGACNVLDHIIICADMKFKNFIFVGAVGGLTEKFEIGDFCTPEVCISGTYSNHYLDFKLPEFKPFEKIYPNKEYTDRMIDLAKESGYQLRTAKVFNTDSIALEYSHLDEIKATGAELIEMETGIFYTLAEAFDVPSIALLAVSDNSATGVPLLGRGEELAQKYIHTRSVVIPDMIFKIAGSVKSE